MEAAHDAYPAPSGANKNAGPMYRLSELSKKDPEPERISVLDLYAYQQISFITPTELWNALNPKEQNFFVDCQDNNEAKLKIQGAIQWDVKENEDLKTEAAFLRRKDNAEGYGYFADHLFPTDPRKLPDMVLFNCQWGSVRSPMMAFWYMRYLLKTYASAVPDRPNVRTLKTRVFILQDGISGLQSAGTPKGLQSTLVHPSNKSGATGSGPSFVSRPQPANHDNTRHVASGVNRT